MRVVVVSSGWWQGSHTSGVGGHEDHGSSGGVDRKIGKKHFSIEGT